MMSLQRLKKRREDLLAKLREVEALIAVEESGSPSGVCCMCERLRIVHRTVKRAGIVYHMCEECAKVVDGTNTEPEGETASHIPSSLSNAYH